MCEMLEKDLYAVLGARPTDSTLQLKHRYQQLALRVNTAARKLSVTKCFRYALVDPPSSSYHTSVVLSILDYNSAQVQLH